MKVPKELQASIHEGVIAILDAHATDDDIDQLLVDEIVRVLGEHKIGEANVMVPVKYIGKRPEYGDSNYGTGLWTQGQSKMVRADIARQMFAHPDVYAEGEDTQEVVVPDDTDVSQEMEQRLNEARDAVNAMTSKKQVFDYLEANPMWPKLPQDVTKLVDMRSFAIQMIDRFGLLS